MTTASPSTRRRLGDILRDYGIATNEQIEAAVKYSQNKGVRIGEALVQMGVLDHDRLSWALGVHLDISHVDLSADIIDWQFVRQFPLSRLRDYRLLPMSGVGGVVRAVVADPTKIKLEEVADELFGGREIIVQLADEEDILSMLSEANRLQQASWHTFELSPRIEDAGEWLDECLAALANKPMGDDYLVFEQDRARPGLCLVARGAFEQKYSPLSSPLSESVLEMLPLRFSSEFPVPGGFAGFTSANGGYGSQYQPPFRATSLYGSRGRLLVFEKLSNAPRAGKGGHTGYRLLTDRSDLAKAAVLKRGGVCFEAHFDSLHPGDSWQFAVPLPELRSAICRRVAPALGGMWTAYVARSSTEMSLAPIGEINALVVIVRDPSANKPKLEPLNTSPITPPLAKAAEELLRSIWSAGLV